MAGPLLSAAVAAAATAVALTGKVAGTQPASVPASPFGGSVPWGSAMSATSRSTSKGRGGRLRSFRSRVSAALRRRPASSRAA